ncbi:MAG: YkgJ family cysteine cluster protein [Desulfococcus multivorans]|jgi:Fe-S-cluster containining protein|nr:YkgJ family cysteine cluster protein [Desulfococcus multivorans]
MGVEEKLAVLDHIYRVYEGFIAEYETACRKGCARCCTRNVTLTTLEAYALSVRLVDEGRADFFEKLRGAIDLPRFIPRVTTNALAEICIRGEDPPEEASDPDWGACPFLEEGACPVYAVRPYGCRCMVSALRCDDTGFAEMDPFIVTVNNVVLQYLEHVDRDGYSGNLTDLLLFFASADNRRRYRAGSLGPPPEGLIRNRPIRALMVPPRHRQKMLSFIESLQKVPSNLP